MITGVNILANGLKFTTYGTLNFFVSAPILKLLLSAESLDPKGQVTKYSPLQGPGGRNRGYPKIAYCSGTGTEVVGGGSCASRGDGGRTAMLRLFPLDKLLAKTLW